MEIIDNNKMDRNKRENNNRINKNNGITLVALVVTIVVLIILATISINAVLGENGLIKKAQQAKQLYENEEAEEKDYLDQLDDYLDDSSYILGLYHQDKLRSYFDTDFSNNVFFVVRNEEKGKVFRKYVNLHISTQINPESKIGISPQVFNQNVTTGKLCDEKGFLLLGWKVDQDTEEIRPDIADEIDITYELEGKQRIGTQIDSTGKIYAIFNDETTALLGQIGVSSFRCPNCMTIKENNLYEETGGSGEFDGIGANITSEGCIMKKLIKV